MATPELVAAAVGAASAANAVSSAGSSPGGLTAADAQVLSAILPLMTGAMTAAVALVAVWLTHRYALKREAIKLDQEAKERRQATRRDRLEKLVALVDEAVEQEVERGMRKGRDLLLLGSGGFKYSPLAVNAEPLRAARSIQSLYFPELTDGLLEMQTAAGRYSAFLSDEWDFAAPPDGPGRWLAKRADSYADRNAEALRPMVAARDAITTTARAILVKVL